MKNIFLSVIIIFFTARAFSQEVKKVSWGLHGGINVSSWSDKERSGLSFTTSSKIGFQGGVDVQLHVSNSITLQPELNFSQMGGAFTLKGISTVDSIGGVLTPANESKIKTTINYLTLPVLAKYTIPNSGLGIYAGPQYGYMLSATVSGEGRNTSVSYVYNKSDFSGIAGAEYFFTCGLGISARYQFGLINIGNSSLANEGETVKNHGFTFTVGYRF